MTIISTNICPRLLTLAVRPWIRLDPGGCGFFDNRDPGAGKCYKSGCCTNWPYQSRSNFSLPITLPMLTGLKQNRHTQELLHTLRHISTLQSSIFSLPTILTGLENDMRVKGGFVHLQRLHGMAFAYGASVIEIVRRREFGEWRILGPSDRSWTSKGKFFMQRAQAIAEVMAKLTQVYLIEGIGFW